MYKLAVRLLGVAIALTLITVIVVLESGKEQSFAFKPVNQEKVLQVEKALGGFSIPTEVKGGVGVQVICDSEITFVSTQKRIVSITTERCPQLLTEQGAKVQIISDGNYKIECQGCVYKTQGESMDAGSSKIWRGSIALTATPDLKLPLKFRVVPSS